MEFNGEESGPGGGFQGAALECLEFIKKIPSKKEQDISFLIQLIVPGKGKNRLFAGLSGLLKTACQENPAIQAQVMEVDTWETEETLVEKLVENAGIPEARHIRYQGSTRSIAFLKEMEPGDLEGREKGVAGKAGLPWKDNGVYLITGGAGGLGLIFAREIAEKVGNPVLVLIGRSRLTPEKQAAVGALEGLGASVEYRRVDVGQEHEVHALIQGVEERFGPLSGIIHGAGVIRDNYIAAKTAEEFKAVLSPKVAGTVILDQATQDVNLDFFILFSSGAGAFGNPGQGDYAAANAFMDAYALYRGELVASGKRHGRTLSINWPLWKAGGMQVDQATETLFHLVTGMVPMETESGIRAFYRGFASRGRSGDCDGGWAGTDKAQTAGQGGDEAGAGILG